MHRYVSIPKSPHQKINSFPWRDPAEIKDNFIARETVFLSKGACFREVGEGFDIDTIINDIDLILFDAHSLVLANLILRHGDKASCVP